MSQDLVTIAETIHAAMIAANANEATAPQRGVFGDLANALRKTLELITGDPEQGDYAYDALMDTYDVKQALEATKTEYAANVDAKQLARTIATTLNIEGWDAVNRVYFNAEELDVDVDAITPKQAAEIESCIAADLKAGK